VGGGEPVVSTDLATALTPERAAAAATVPRTGVAFPIVGGDRVLGVVELLTRTERPIDDELPPVLAGVGRQLGQFLIRMRSEEERASLADTLQRSLLPPHLPHPEGLQLAAAYRAGGTGVDVGGDFYDVFAVDASTWDVVVGDVCGKGAEAATTTALARYTLRAAAIHSDAPSRCCASSTSAAPGLRRHAVPDRGVRPVAARGRRVLRHGVLRGASASGAGLRDGGVQAVGEPGSLLGVLADPDLVDVRLRLDAGDTLVLYTDGVIEARSSRGVPFGDDRLLALLAATYDRRSRRSRAWSRPRPTTGTSGTGRPRRARGPVEAAAGDAGRTGDGTVEWLELPCDPGSTAQARRFAAAIVTRAGAAGALRTVELVVSELVANGVRHAHHAGDRRHLGRRARRAPRGARHRRRGARVVKPSQDASPDEGSASSRRSRCGGVSSSASRAVRGCGASCRRTRTPTGHTGYDGLGSGYAAAHEADDRLCRGGTRVDVDATAAAHLLSDTPWHAVREGSPVTVCGARSATSRRTRGPRRARSARCASRSSRASAASEGATSETTRSVPATT
jgi:hypothetical protein